MPHIKKSHDILGNPSPKVTKRRITSKQFIKQVANQYKSHILPRSKRRQSGRQRQKDRGIRSKLHLGSCSSSVRIAVRVWRANRQSGTSSTNLSTFWSIDTGDASVCGFNSPLKSVTTENRGRKLERKENHSQSGHG